MKTPMRKTILWVGLMLVIIALAAIALGHTGPGEQKSTVRLLPFDWLPGAASCVIRQCPAAAASRRLLVSNGLGNIVVFMPLGVLLYATLKHQAPFLDHPVLYIMLFGALVSLIFEIVQLWIPGRVTALDDVILNTAGTLLGSLSIKWREGVLNPNG
jgi:glycopeptide antibiotics resistance protein